MVVDAQLRGIQIPEKSFDLTLYPKTQNTIITGAIGKYCSADITCSLPLADLLEKFSLVRSAIMAKYGVLIGTHFSDALVDSISTQR